MQQNESLPKCSAHPAFSSLNEALQASCADAALIALPTNLHHDAVIPGLKTGLHVKCTLVSSEPEQLRNT